MDSPSARNGPQKTTKVRPEGLEFYYRAPLQNSDMKYNKYEVRNDRIANSDRPYRGRRLSWAELYQIRPDLKPANDNAPENRGGNMLHIPEPNASTP